MRQHAMLSQTFIITNVYFLSGYSPVTSSMKSLKFLQLTLTSQLIGNYCTRKKARHPHSILRVFHIHQHHYHLLNMMAIPSHNCFARDVVFCFAVDISGFLGCVCVIRLLMPKMVQEHLQLARPYIVRSLPNIVLSVFVLPMCSYSQTDTRQFWYTSHCHNWKFSCWKYDTFRYRSLKLKFDKSVTKMESLKFHYVLAYDSLSRWIYFDL